MKKLMIPLVITATVASGFIAVHYASERDRSAVTTRQSYINTYNQTNARTTFTIEDARQPYYTGSEVISDGTDDLQPLPPADETPNDAWIDADPIDGDTLIFPEVGEVFSGRIINTQQTFNLPRSNQDTCTWEFAYGYISNTTVPRLQRMRRRAQALSPYVVNAGSNDPLKVRLNDGEELYVGCLPISGFGQLGDIVEFTYTDGSSIKVLCVDAKASNDAAGTGFANQANTQYCHAVRSGDTWRLSAIELWCGGSATRYGTNFPNVNKNVAKAKIVGHTNILNGL